MVTNPGGNNYLVIWVMNYLGLGLHGQVSDQWSLGAYCSERV